MPVEPMDSLLEELQSDGDFESIGRFTLDPAKAREKLQKFQLVEPHTYPVHLIAAAVASGATRVDLHLDADDLKLDFDGRPFLAEEMENLFASLFSSERHAWLIRLKELAIGINAALVSKPRWIDVESQSGQQGIHLRVYPDRDRLERVRPGPNAGTRIHVRQRMGLKTVMRFLSKRTSPEEMAIRERCRLCPIPVRLNGEQVSQPLAISTCLVLTHLRGGPHELAVEGSEGAMRLEEASPGDYSAWVALDRESGRGALHWIVNGVSHIEGFSARAWVITGTMPKDVSQASLVQGEEWQRVVAELQEVRLRQLQALARGFAELEPTVQAMARELLLHTLGQGLQHGQPVPPEMLPLAEAPLLTLAHGPPVSLSDLLEQSRQLGWVHCRVTEGRWPCPPLDGTLIVHVDAWARECIQKAFKVLQASDWALAEAQQALEHRREFEAEIPGEMQFERGTTVFLEATFLGPSFRGVLGLSTVTDALARMRIYKGGRQLVARKIYETLPEGLVILADHPDLEPNLRWDGVRENDPGLLAVEAAVRRELPRLYARAAEMVENAQGALREGLEQSLVAFLVYCAQAGAEPGKVASLPLFSGYCYEELREQYDRLGYLPVTDRYADVKPLEDVKVVKGQPHMERLGFERLRSYDHELKAAKLHYDSLARWENSPRVPVRVPEATSLVKLTLPEGRGELVLPAGPPHNTVQLYFFREERSLGKRYFPGTPRLGGLPAGLLVALSDDDFPRNPDWAGASDGPVLDAALARLQPFIDQLFALLGENFPEFEPARSWAQGYLVSYLSWAPMLPDPALLQALTLDGIGSQRYSLQALFQAVEREGYVRAVRGCKPLTDVPGLPEPFLRLPEELWSALDRWLGPGTIQEASAEYERASNASVFWEREIEEPVLTGPVRLRLPLEGFVGEVALLGDGPGLASLHLNVRVLHGGRPLTDWQVPMGPLAGVPQVSFGRLRAAGVIEVGDATANADWTDLAAGVERDAVREALRAAGRRLFLALAAELPGWEEGRDELLSYLWGQLKVEIARQDKGIFEEARREMTRAPLFPLLGGGWASLLDLRQEIEKNDRVGYLVGQSDLPAVDSPIVMVRRELLPLLRALLGVQHTADATVTVNALSRAAVHRRSAPVEQLQLPEHPYLAVAVLGGQREGRVGLSPVVGGPSRVQLLLERRPLAERKLQLPYTLEAIVNDDHLRPNLDFTAVAEGPELTRALYAVEEAGNQLVLGQALSWTGDPTSHRPELREWLIQVACRIAAAPESPLGRDLLELPLFLTATLDRLTLAQLRRAPRLLALPLDLPAEPRPEELLPEGSVALLLSAVEESALGALLPLANYLTGYQAARRFYCERPEEYTLRLPPADYLSSTLR